MWEWCAGEAVICRCRCCCSLHVPLRAAADGKSAVAVAGPVRRRHILPWSAMRHAARAVSCGVGWQLRLGRRLVFHCHQLLGAGSRLSDCDGCRRVGLAVVIAAGIPLQQQCRNKEVRHRKIEHMATCRHTHSCLRHSIMTPQRNTPQQTGLQRLFGNRMEWQGTSLPGQRAQLCGGSCGAAPRHTPALLPLHSVSQKEEHASEHAHGGGNQAHHHPNLESIPAATAVLHAHALQ